MKYAEIEHLRELEGRLHQTALQDPSAAVSEAKGMFFEALASGQEETLRLLPRAVARLPLSWHSRQAWASYFRCITAADTEQWDEAERQGLRTLRLADTQELRSRACNELGILYDHLGRWHDAISFYRRGLVFCGAWGDASYLAKLAKNLGTAMVRGVEAGLLPRTTLSEAETLVQNALSTFTDLGLSRLEASAWNELGTIHKAQGQWLEAEICYERFREQCAARDDRLGEGKALGNIGEVLLQAGQVTRAETMFLRALALVTGRVWEEVDVYVNLALTYAAQDQFESAAQSAERAIAGVESLRARQQVASVRTDLFSVQQRPYAVGAHVALRLGRTEALFAAAERSKARTFSELLAGGQLLQRSHVPRRWLREEAALRRRMSEASGQLQDGQVDLESSIAEMEARWQELRQRIVRRDANFGSLGFASPLDLAQVQERLPPAVAVLEYLEAGNELVACLVQASDVIVQPLGISASVLRESSFDQRARPRGMVTGGSGLGRPWILQRLGQTLLWPLLPHLGSVQRLCVVPHGVLHQLPFGALPVDGDGGTLAEHIGAVQQAPSATIWLEHCQQRRKAPARDACILGFNGSALQHAEAEAAAVAASLGTTAHLADSATRTVLEQEGCHARWVHLACTGSFRADQPLRSGLQLADGFLDVATTLRRLRLEAELVVLSGCETGLGDIINGDEIVGLVRAWLYAGSNAALVSLWQVDDLSTRLFMEDFYAHLPQAGAAKAVMLAQSGLRAMSWNMLVERLSSANLSDIAIRDYQARLARLWGAMRPDRPLDHPYFWAGFVLQGGRLADNGS